MKERSPLLPMALLQTSAHCFDCNRQSEIVTLLRRVLLSICNDGDFSCEARGNRMELPYLFRSNQNLESRSSCLTAKARTEGLCEAVRNIFACYRTEQALLLVVGS